MKKLELTGTEIGTIAFGLQIAADDLLVKIDNIDNSEDVGKNLLSGSDFEKAVLRKQFDNINEIMLKLEDL